MKHLLHTLPLLLCSTALLPAGNWPQFRGPTGQGIFTETNLPLKWSATENVVWKTTFSGESWSSPIVWGDSVFLTTATDNGVSCRVLCLDRSSGRILWNKEALQQTTAGRKEGGNTYATPTPATDGNLVFTVFFDGSFAALNFAGEIVWANRQYPFYSQHGLGTSPILWKDLLIQARDGSSGGGPANSDAKLILKDNVVECAIPWRELPEVKRRNDTGQPVKFSFRVNNGGGAFELAAGRSVSKDNPLSFHNDWATHWADEVEFGFERRVAPAN